MLLLDEPTSGLDPVAAHEVHELVEELRRRGVTIFLSTHRLYEAERLCDRVAILNTTLRAIGRPDELRERMFTKTLTVRTLAPVRQPNQVFGSLPGVESWRPGDEGAHILDITDADTGAPAVTLALVAAGADVLFVGESQHTLEDVYLELVNEDVAAESGRI